jgi:hypothetical protein
MWLGACRIESWQPEWQVAGASKEQAVDLVRLDQTSSIHP